MRLRLFLLCLFCLIANSAALSAHDHPPGFPDIERNCVVKQKILKSGSSVSILNAVRPSLEKEVVSPSGRFLIHYDISGASAVALSDANSNGIPDFVDSTAYYADYVYEQEINVLGFQRPRIDGFDTAHIDIYLMQIGSAPGSIIDGSHYSGAYGLAFETDTKPSACNSSTNVASGFLVIDNNFAISDSVSDDNGKRKRVYADTGFTALRVTLAHEFHHLVQFSYASDISTRTYPELTSVWMEHRVFPGSIDYFQYLRLLMNNTDSFFLTNTDKPASSGYAHAFFFQYLQEHSNAEAVLRMWQLIGSCSIQYDHSDIFPYLALDSALREKGSSLGAEWKRFMTFVYHTGHRTPLSADTLSNAASMPMLYQDNNKNITFTEPFSYDFSLYPYQFKMIRCTFSTDAAHAADTADFLCTNTGVNYLGTKTMSSIDVRLMITRVQQSGYHRIGTTDYFYSIEGTGSDRYDTLFLNGGIAVSQIESPYPQPFIITFDKQINFPISEQVPSDAKVRLTISSLDGVPAYAEDVPVISDAQARVRYVTWLTTPQNLQSGVYMYSIGYKDQNYVGTILIRQ